MGLQRLLGIEDRCGDRVDERAEEWLEVFFLGHAAVGGTLERCTPSLGAGVDDREVDLLLGGVEVEEELIGLVDHLADARVRSIDLVDDEHDGKVLLQRLAQYEARLRERALGCVDEQDDTVDHLKPALDLAAEVSVTGGVDDVEGQATLGSRSTHVADRGVLREDRDALLTLEVHGVHDTVIDVLVLTEGTRLPEHGVDQRGLAMVDVGDDGDVAEIFAAIHPTTLRGSSRFDQNVTNGRKVMGRAQGFSARNTCTTAFAWPWPMPWVSLRKATCSMWALPLTFLSSFIQKSMGLPYFFSMEGK